ncbi:MAG TPA: acetyl-CoA carboxylase carboxyltransferase subunit alpha [Kineosporiaceae bacterium]|nr:acetyl-CoA carboxylase carboxyltransferase subunit alpha [Kineosporiaceae bacterium]
MSSNAVHPSAVGAGTVRAGTVRRWLDRVCERDWARCPDCARFLHHRRLEHHAGTCPGCGHHFPLDAPRRIEFLTDPESWQELDPDMSPLDPLDFVDSQPYPQRIAALRRRTGSCEAARYGSARISGHDVVLCVLDFSFQGGSMGAVVGEKVARAAELAEATRTALVICSTSGGARMQEGVISLLQMAKTAAAIQRLHAAGVLFVSILCDPVYGGVSASFASLGDVIIAEPRARIGFAGPGVIEQTIRQKLPEGFQSAEFLLDKGHIDAVVPRLEQRAYLSRLLAVHGTGRPPAVGARVSDPVDGAGHGPGRSTGGAVPADPWRTVLAARHPGRPNIHEYLHQLTDDFVELHGDRHHGDDSAVVAGPAVLAGRAVMVIGHRKGRGTQDNVARNFGMPHPAGYRKAARLMRYAERFGMPVVTVIDTPGAYPGVQSEEANQSAAIAENLQLMSSLRTPVVSLVIGEGGSGGALALGVCDRLLMLQNAIYSVISPEGCAAILFRDVGRAPEAAAALRLTAADLQALGIVDEVVPEPSGGAHTDHGATVAAVRRALLRHLDEVTSVPLDRLLRDRYRRLRTNGPVSERPTPDTTGEGGMRA